jgi:pimeloyl-ACP methyl ester carboxylesterase
MLPVGNLEGEMTEHVYGAVLRDGWARSVERDHHPADGSLVFRAVDPGDGPGYVLLHGVGNSGAIFGPIMPTLAEHGPVVAPTLSPELLSGPDGELATSMTPLVEWIAEVAPPPWRLVGHSMGGVLTGLILRSHPELVEGAVLLNSPLPGVIDRIRGGDTLDRTGRALLFMKLLSRVTALGRPRLPRLLRGPELVIVRNALRGFVADPGALDDRVIARAVLATRTTDGIDFLELAREMPLWEADPFTDVPVRIVLGEADPLVPPADHDHVASAYPDADIDVLAPCAHFAHLEQPRATVDSIREFFGALRV